MASTMTIIYRRARAEDLQRADELVVASINGLCERHGFMPIAVVRQPTFAMFSLHDDPDGLWIAEEAGKILGFALSWACGDFWFLAQLFVSPDRQGCGIGQALLQRTIGHARMAKAGTKALITFAFNAVSQGLYMRIGLFPRCPIYNFKVARNAVAADPDGERLRCVPLENTSAHCHALAQIDSRALGISRAKHHGFLASDAATRGFLLYTERECAGYAYVADGHIGPLAVMHRATLSAAFTTAIDLAAEGSAAQVSAFVPGSCDEALRVAIAAGMRITTPMVLMATRDFGNWTQYFPRSPGFM
jgi:GNAT superfamily N-acetyltransferase